MVIVDRKQMRRRVRITSQGQITVPKQVRDALGVGPGDELEFEVADGRAVVSPRPRRSILDFAGIAGSSSTRLPRTAAELDALLEQTAEQRARRRIGR